MSQENVEIVQAFFEAWNAGDMDAVREMYDPDVIVRTAEGWLEPGPYVGREAVMRWFEQLRETWDADVLEPISAFIDAADHVVVKYVWRGVGHGPESNMELTLVFTVRKRRIFYVEFFWDHAEALETLGLREQATSRENVEIVRRFYEAWNRREEETQTEAFAPEIEFRTAGLASPVGLDAVYYGHAGLRKFTHEFREPWEQLFVDPERIIDRGEQLVALLRLRGKGRDGIEVERPFAHVWTMRGERAVRVEGYADQQKALEAVGLSE